MQQSSLALRLCPFKRLLMGMLFVLFFPVLLLAQAKNITGTVTDETGNPLDGVSVSVKNSAKGTTTDVSGKFSISAEPGAHLEFSSVNYETYEVEVGSQATLAVTLKAKAGSLNSVIVVGYATQKKVNSTGAVSTITAGDLASRPVTNVSSALAGLAPGMFVRQGSGKPGSDGATIRIRGVGTLNNSDPLIVVDGIISSMDAVNPDDIQSMSILKDAASASIYGALAANGVILITTKKGSPTKTTVTYSGYATRTGPMNKIDFVTNYARHMRLINESLSNLNQSIQFPDATIQAWEQATANPNGTNANGVPNWLAYPNTDWYDAVISKNTGQSHNLSVSGGSDKVLYLLSLNYLNNPGLMRHTGTERYQLRANVEAKINKVITLGTQTFASLQSFGLANTDNVYTYLNQTTPGVYPYYDGKYGYPSATEESPTANNIVSYLDGTGGSDQQTRINTTLYANLHFFKGFSFESKLNYQTRSQERNTHSNPINRWDFATNTLRVAATTPNLLSTGYAFNKDYRVTIDQVLRYNTRIGTDHELGALVGYNEFYFNYYDFNASKLGLIDYNITTLGSAGNTTNTAGGQEYDRAMRSLFGRLNYTYKNKYILEANLRYDGSSRFANDNRWGYFPSVSGAWKVSEENFFAGLKDQVSNLKVRASWGKLGNVGLTTDGTYDYAYQAFYSPVNYSFNGVASTGLYQGTTANAMLQWETTTQTDIGIEATLFKSLNIELDWYNRSTDAILTSPPIPLVLGTATAPYQNTAALYNRGIELNVGWDKKIGNVNLSLSGNFAYNKNMVTRYKGKLSEGFVTDASGNKVYNSNLGAVSNNGANSLILEDHMMNELYMQTLYKGNGSYNNGDGSVNPNGGPKDGMIRTPDDLAWVNAMIAAGYKFAPVTGTATATNKALLNYGDFIYADNNGDGIYGNTYDRKFTNSSTTPKYNFGFSVGLNWKNFDFSMLWAGSTGMQYYWNDGYNTVATRNGFHVTKAIADDHYYYNESNPSDPNNNINGKYSRLKYNSDAQNSAYSNFWLYDASYIKLKNLQIGYTIPAKLSSRALISRARVYVSGENLLLITKYPGLDPEIGSSFGYPTLRQFSAGVTVTF